MSDKIKVDSSVDIAEKIVENHKSVESEYHEIPVVLVRRSRLGYNNENEYVCYNPIPSIDYPPTQTDQTHGLTLAQQIKVGSAQMRDESPDDYDFVKGQKDDGREAYGMLEWSEPAELAEREYQNSSDIQTQLRSQLAQRRQNEKLSDSKKSESGNSADENKIAES